MKHTQRILALLMALCLILASAPGQRMHRRREFFFAREFSTGGIADDGILRDGRFHSASSRGARKLFHANL